MAPKRVVSVSASPPPAGLTPARPVEVLPSGAVRSARVLLRPLTPGDRKEFLRLVRRSRDHLARFSALHLPGESDEAMFDRQLELTAEGDATGRAWRRVVVDSTGRIIGACNLNSIRRGLSWDGDVNWWLGAGAVGKGYAREALSALLRHAFADLPDGLGLHRVLAGIQADNQRSIHLAEALGFRRCGPEKSYLHSGGKWDLHEMFDVTPERFADPMAAG